MAKKLSSNLIARSVAFICAVTLGFILSTVFSPKKEEPVKVVTPVSSREIVRGATDKKQVIFTFDGGDGVQSAEQILAILAKHHVTGTFFLTGKMVENHLSVVKKIAEAGHEIFNHTYDHKDLTTLSDLNILSEFEKMENTLLTNLGISTKPYFRPPYGARNEHVRTVAAEAGYQSVYWTIDALDWKESSGETAEQVRDRILSNVAPGTIYLMHLGDTITGAILDDIFTTIEGRGYKLVSLTQGM